MRGTWDRDKIFHVTSYHSGHMVNGGRQITHLQFCLVSIAPKIKIQVISQFRVDSILFLLYMNVFMQEIHKLFKILPTWQRLHALHHMTKLQKISVIMRCIDCKNALVNIFLYQQYNTLSQNNPKELYHCRVGDNF